MSRWLEDFFYWGIPEGAREEYRQRRRDSLGQIFRVIQIGGILYALFWIGTYLGIPYLHGLRQLLGITTSHIGLYDCAAKVFYGILTFFVGKFMAWLFRS